MVEESTDFGIKELQEKYGHGPSPRVETVNKIKEYFSGKVAK